MTETKTIESPLLMRGKTIVIKNESDKRVLFSSDKNIKDEDMMPIDPEASIWLTSADWPFIKAEKGTVHLRVLEYDNHREVTIRNEP